MVTKDGEQEERILFLFLMKKRINNNKRGVFVVTRIIKLLKTDKFRYLFYFNVRHVILTLLFIILIQIIFLL